MFNKLFSKEQLLELAHGKPVATVEEIHEEFDSAQDRLLRECEDILNNLEIPTEGEVERKASDLEALGFVNSETVENYKIFKQSVAKVQNKIAFTENQASEIKELAFKYPFEKFITLDELNRICDKYGLIHAPVANYIKDVPEKNVLEMKNRKPLAFEDAIGKLYQLGGIKDDTLFRRFNIKDNILNEGIIRKLLIGIDVETWRVNSIMGWLGEGSTTSTYSLFRQLIGDTPEHDQYVFQTCTEIDQTGLQVAAPKSHFKLEGLNKITKFGFADVREIEVKDPVVFELCKNNIVRIITKWGTDDDQSYLDDSLVNPVLN
tara:strand:- start:1701 stop:2657 length:957 start_codon:yes stop_codon:yes gene_type:complete